MKENKRTNISISSLIFGITLFLVIISGVTFSIYGWETGNDEWTNIAFLIENQEQGYTCFADGGGDIVPGEVVIVPATCDSNNAIVREITTNVEFESDSLNSVNMDLWLNVNNLAGPLSESENLRYVLTDSATSCTDGVISSGSFNGKNAGDKVDLVSSSFSKDETKKYYLYVWLDEAETNVATANQSFDLSLGGTCGVESSTVNFDLQGGSLFENIEYSKPGEHVFTVPYDGEYQLEVWGAQGGYSLAQGEFTTGSGGYGGYSSGSVQLEEGSNIYINVGGKGSDAILNVDASGGYNGGGASWFDNNDNESSGGGGGATHIAKSSGLLSTLSTSVSDIFIVAGGGGGGSYGNAGGNGGGYMGTNINNSSDSQGTQSSGYMFGLGGDGTYVTTSPGGGGGGGFYGGKGGTGDSITGSGGSGYIGNSLLTNKVMYCYNCETSTEENTLTYSTIDVSDEAVSCYAKIGSGAAKITFVSDVSKIIVLGQSYGKLPVPTKEDYIFSGWNTKSDGSGTYITSDTVVSDSLVEKLYAMWEEIPKFTISYDANGGTGVPDSQIKKYGVPLTLSSTIPTRTGYAFLGWGLTSTDTSVSYQVGGEFNVNVDTVLYAIWKELSSPVESYSCSNGSAGSEPYFFTYTGKCTVINDGDGNWRVKFLNDGTFDSSFDMDIDVFLVGGGGNGGNARIGGGGGGGYTLTKKDVHVIGINSYDIVVGEATEATKAFGYVANQGKNGVDNLGGAGGSGGGGPTYAGGSNGGNGKGTVNVVGTANYGIGQGTTTREFGEDTGILYAGGGGGGWGYNAIGDIINGGGGGEGGGGRGALSSGTGAVNGTANTGGGGGGGAKGGSGIVVIRNIRTTSFNFTINGKSYEAVRNVLGPISWSEWLNDSYNTDGYFETQGFISDASQSGFLYNTVTKKFCSLSEAIIEGGDYLLLTNVPKFTYTGSYQIVNDSDQSIETLEDNWKIRFLSTGEFTVYELNDAASGIDVFLVGGGGKGGFDGGGGGGYTLTQRNISVESKSYNIIVGESDSDTSAFGFTAECGKQGSSVKGGDGGSGGGSRGGNNGGVDGGDGGGNGGKGQVTNTREFGEIGGVLYSGGGGGSWCYGEYIDGSPVIAGINGGSGGDGGGGHGASYNGNYAMTAGKANTGGGGGGSFGSDGALGGSGIVIIRNAR